MPLNLNAYLGLDPLALKLLGRRMEVLANNLANADTPNFKAQDLDFQSVLAAAAVPGGDKTSRTSAPFGAGLPQAAALGALAARPAAAAALGGAPSAGAAGLVVTDARHLGGAAAASADAALKYRIPLAPSLDGNTVDAQLEQSAFAENTVRYQATLTFLSTKFRDLMTAITGS